MGVCGGCAPCGCCKQDPNEQVFKPRSQRWCTDIFCLLLIICAWVTAGALVVSSVNKDPDVMKLLVYPKDSYGQFCGDDSNVKDLTKLVYPDLDSDFTSQASWLATAPYWEYYKLRLTGICAASCPEEHSLTAPTTYGGSSYPMPVNGTECPMAGCGTEWYYNYKTTQVLKRCLPQYNTYSAPEVRVCGNPGCAAAKTEASIDVNSCLSVDSRADETDVWEICPAGSSESECAAQESYCKYETIWKGTDYFVSANATADNSKYTSKFSGYLTLVLGTFEGMWAFRWGLLGFGVGLPLAVGFTWVILLFLFAGVFIWCLVFFVLIALIILDATLFVKAGVVSESLVDGAADLAASVYNSSSVTSIFDESDSNKQLYLIGAIIMAILTVVYIIFVLGSVKLIRRAIAIVQEVSKVFQVVPVLMVWPITGLLFQFALIAFGMVSLFLVGYPTVWEGTSERAAVLTIVIFVYIWSIQFINACQYTTISATVAHWFVTDNTPGTGCCSRLATGCKTTCGLSRVLDSAWTVASRHLGSMAFGAALVAICQLIRLGLNLLDEATKDAQGKNLAIKLIVKCTKCAMWCLQKTIEFVSSYAYVFVAIEGKNFCAGCKDTFALLVKYPAQVAVNQLVKGLLTVLMGWSTPIGCALVTYYYLKYQDWYIEEYSPFYPALTVLAMSYFVAQGITEVYRCSIDTIYLSVFEDMENNKPPKFMSNSLRSAFGVDKADEEAGNSKERFKSAAQKKEERAQSTEKVAAAGGDNAQGGGTDAGGLARA